MFGTQIQIPSHLWPTKPYREDLSLTKEEEKMCWRYWVVHKGFLEKQGTPEFPYNFFFSMNKVQCQIQIQTNGGCCMGTCNKTVGGDVGTRNDPFLTTFTYLFLPHPTLLCTLNICFSFTRSLNSYRYG